MCSNEGLLLSASPLRFLLDFFAMVFGRSVEVDDLFFPELDFPRPLLVGLRVLLGVFAAPILLRLGVLTLSSSGTSQDLFEIEVEGALSHQFGTKTLIWFVCLNAHSGL